jgi:DNA invertase Pin-like site-specific DNA recombinase
MVAVAELEAGMISKRTKDALAAAKKRGTKLGGRRRKIIGEDARGKPIYGAVANGSPKARADQRATRHRPNDQGTAGGAASLKAIADGLNARRIPTARGAGEWSPMQVQRVLGRPCSTNYRSG